MPRVASRLGVNVAGALPFEVSGAFRRWISTSRVIGTDRDLLVDGQAGNYWLIRWSFWETRL